MRARSLLRLIASLGIGVSCSDRTPTVANERGTWGSSEASLTVGDSGATLQILASGGCYGSYGNIVVPIPTGSFTLAGTYTQLTGAYPGKVQYEAQYSGSVIGRTMSITIAVPGLQRTLGPYALTYGVKNAWNACLYP
jgi:hypothetical protein